MGRAGRLLPFVVLVMAGGCSKAKPAGACQSNSDCHAGFICDASKCEKVCASDVGCRAGQICQTSLCVSGARSGDPSIAGIDGDSTVADGASGHAAHLMDSHLLIKGSNLLGSQVTLNNGSKQWDLTVCDARDDQLSVVLPADLPKSAAQPTNYTLTVTNQVSSCSATLPVLQGIPGAQGDPGAPGQPQTSVDGLAGGTLSSGLNVSGDVDATGDANVGGSANIAGNATVDGDTTLAGNLNVNGSVTINGVPYGYPTGPLILMGVTTTGCQAGGGFNLANIRFPTNFPNPPIFVATINEAGDNNGAVWQRLLRGPFTNRVAIRCNATSDATDWLAIEPGTHTIDSKQVMAGRLASATNNASVFFPALFPSAPVVITEIDASATNTGAAWTRIINTVSTGGFQVYLNAAVDGLDWIAMEPGEYHDGRYHWVAGVFNANNSCNNPCSIDISAAGFASAPGVVLTVQDTNNSGGAVAARVRAVTPSSVSFNLYNTTPALANTEMVHYIAFEELH